jgi:hypothetical protein
MSNGQKRGAELDRLEQDINTLRVDFERFFNGDLEIPPEQARESIRVQISSLQAANKSPVESFRLGSLEARFHSWSELFNRRLRNLELQHTAPRRTTRAGTTTIVDAAQGIVLGERFDSNRVAPLYRSLYREQAAATMDLDTFTSYLARQHQLIRDRTGCSQVSFRIVEEDGKKKLKAKPVREAATA